jgi:hypothetical protein
MYGDAVYLDEICSVYRRHEGGISDGLWGGGDLLYEVFRPNNIWMYWLLQERFLPPSSKVAIERCIRDLVNDILRYAVMHKGVSRDYSKLTTYLWDVLRKHKPVFLSDGCLEKGGPLREVIDSQRQAFWRSHRKHQLRNVTNKLINLIFDWHR